MLIAAAVYAADTMRKRNVSMNVGTACGRPVFSGAFIFARELCKNMFSFKKIRENFFSRNSVDNH